MLAASKRRAKQSGKFLTSSPRNDSTVGTYSGSYFSLVCAERLKTVLLPSQMAEDGSFPLELRRTIPYGYSLFNIDAFCNVAQILASTGENLWEFETADGNP